MHCSTPRRTIPFKVRISDTTSGPQLRWGGGLILNPETGSPADNSGHGLMMIDLEKEEFLLVS